MPRIVDSVLVDDDGSDQSTELDQRMPVAAVARETRGFNRKHGADTALTDCRQQALEARACDTAARAAEIIVNDLDSGPAKLFGAIGEPVLAAPALLIVCQLVGCRLTDVDTGAACKMLSRDLGHDCSPLCKRRCDLAQQGLHQWRQIGLLLGRQVDAWCVLLEKARLEIFGSARHYRLPPLLIRIGESLKAHRPRCAVTAKYQGKNVACRGSRNATLPPASSRRADRQANCPAVE